MSDEDFILRYRPAPAGPDPARDARVAARRTADAARAGRALDRLIASHGEKLQDGYYYEGWFDGYVEAGLHHNRAYGVVPDEVAVHVPHRHYPGPDNPCSKIECHAQGGRPCSYCGGAPCRVYTISPHCGVVRGDSAEEQRDAANEAYGDYPFQETYPGSGVLE